MTEHEAPELTRLPQFLLRLEQGDGGRASLARQLLDAGWLVDDFWGPVQMDVWGLTLRRRGRAVVFGIERGVVDEARVGDAAGEFRPLSFAVLGWARSHGAPVPFDDPDAFRPDLVAHGVEALEWLEKGHDDVLVRIQAAWDEYRRRRWSMDQRLGKAWLAETKARGIREIEAAAALTGRGSRTDRLGHTGRMSAAPHTSDPEPTEPPADLLLWRERQRKGLPTPWEDLGIRLLEADEQPELLDDSYLTEDDLANPDIRANVRAMAETNALIAWVAEEDGERAYGYWDGPPGESAAEPVLVALDTEGQYLTLPGRTLTEALCADAVRFEDDAEGAYAALVARSRALASETDTALAAAMVEGETLAELWNPVIHGPGRYRDTRYTTLLQEADSGEGSEDRDPAPDPAPAPDPVRAGELPEDLLLWRERAARGEGAPWDRFGIRFLEDGELPRVLDLPDPALEPAPEDLDAAKHHARVEATRQTAALVTWVAETAQGHGIGYWHTADRVPIGEAEIIEVDTDQDFEHIAGSTLTEALCVLCGDWEDETVAPLLRECRELGVEIAGETIDHLPYMESQRPNYDRSKRYDELLRELTASARRAAAEAAAEREASAPRSDVVVEGDLLTVIAALGHGVDDAEVEEALALFGPPFERSQFPIGPVTRTYYVAEQKHTELIFEDGVLEDVMIWLRSSEEHGAYARPEGLIDGVGPDTTREQVLERFGTPEWSNAHADRFWIAGDAPNRVFVRFEYVDGGVGKISVTRETAEG